MAKKIIIMIVLQPGILLDVCVLQKLFWIAVQLFPNTYASQTCIHGMTSSKIILDYLVFVIVGGQNHN